MRLSKIIYSCDNIKWIEQIVTMSWNNLIEKYRWSARKSYFGMNVSRVLLKFIYSEKAMQNFVIASPYFCPMLCQSKVRWRFCKILWPSQNIWTLKVVAMKCDTTFPLLTTCPQIILDFIMLVIGHWHGLLFLFTTLGRNIIWDINYSTIVNKNP